MSYVEKGDPEILILLKKKKRDSRKCRAYRFRELCQQVAMKQPVLF